MAIRKPVALTYDFTDMPEYTFTFDDGTTDHTRGFRKGWSIRESIETVQKQWPKCEISLTPAAQDHTDTECP